MAFGWDSAYQIPTGGMDDRTRQAEDMAILERRIAMLERAQSAGMQRAKATTTGTLSVAAGANTQTGPEVTVSAIEGTMFIVYVEVDMRKLTGGSAFVGLRVDINGSFLAAVPTILTRANTAFSPMATVPGSTVGVNLGSWGTGMNAGGALWVPPNVTTTEGTYRFYLNYFNDGSAGSSEYRNRIMHVLAV